MKGAIEGRELFVLTALGTVLHGTYHKTHEDSLDAPAQSMSPERIGVLFINGLSAMRSSKGDSAAYWADACAEHGYPSFRVDLPGYGDSEGEIPKDQLGFINQGGFRQIFCSLIDALSAQFRLSGVVLVAHCSGTVSAIYTAADSSKCKGIVLMDPYFHVSQVKAPKMRRTVHEWALKSGLNGHLRKLYDGLKRLFLSIRRASLPENANLHLLHCWKQITAARLPILILKRSELNSSGVRARKGEFDYMSRVLAMAGHGSRVELRIIEGAHHSFANRAGRAAVRQCTEQWLDAIFPRSAWRDPDAGAVGAERSERHLAVEAGVGN